MKRTIPDLQGLLEAAFDRASTGMCVVGLDRSWLRVNDAYCELMGYSREELENLTYRDLTHPDDRQRDDEWRERAMAGSTEPLIEEKRYVGKDGRIIWVDLRVEMMMDDEGRPMYSVSLLQDITEKHQALVDLRSSERELRLILDNIPSAVSVRGRDYSYRLVNRAFEKRIGEVADGKIRFPEVDAPTPEAIAEDRAIHTRVLISGERIQEEAVASTDGEERTYESIKFPLLDENGEIYAVGAVLNDVTDRKRREVALKERLAWTEQIRSSVTEERLVLHGQPIVNLATGETEQAELLVRMKDSRDPGRLVPPGDFLPAAEKFDLISVIDQWVVGEALELARKHRVEINLSGMTISDPVQVAKIERMVAESTAPRENIIFEITETAVAENLAPARAFAERLRGLGCEFALDDFGVGFGTFTYLKHLPVDYLKIDIEFVRDLISDEANRQVVSSIVSAADLFGMKTIAEGVEDRETIDALTGMGVDYAQGLYVGPPQPTSDLFREAGRPVFTGSAGPGASGLRMHGHR